MSYKLITLTAGHNNIVPGATGNGYKEHEQARLLVVQLEKDFKAVGQKVTICTDEVGTTQTAVWSNAVKNCNSHPAVGRLDISVHLNAGGGTGVEVLYYSEKELAAKVSKAVAEVTGFKDRGAKQRKDIGFLNSTNAPAILIEACFIDNKTDMEIFISKLKEISTAIVCAVTGKIVQRKEGQVVDESIIEMTDAQKRAIERLSRHGYVSEDFKITNEDQKMFISIIYALVRDLEERGVYKNM